MEQPCLNRHADQGHSTRSAWHTIPLDRLSQDICPPRAVLQAQRHHVQHRAFNLVVSRDEFNHSYELELAGGEECLVEGLQGTRTLWYQ